MKRLDELKLRFQAEPLGKLLGARLEVLEDGLAWVTASAGEGTTIVGGIVQGGITTVLADYAGVYAAMTRIPEGHTPCAHINIHFLRPIRLGETMRAMAHVTGETRGSLIVAVDVHGMSADGGSWQHKACATVLFSKPRT